MLVGVTYTVMADPRLHRLRLCRLSHLLRPDEAIRPLGEYTQKGSGSHSGPHRRFPINFGTHIRSCEWSLDAALMPGASLPQIVRKDRNGPVHRPARSRSTIVSSHVGGWQRLRHGQGSHA